MAEEIKALQGSKVKLVSAACGQDHTLLLSKSGCVYACGEGSSGQLGMLPGEGQFEDKWIPTQIQVLREVTDSLLFKILIFVCSKGKQSWFTVCLEGCDGGVRRSAFDGVVPGRQGVRLGRRWLWSARGLSREVDRARGGSAQPHAFVSGEPMQGEGDHLFLVHKCICIVPHDLHGK